MINPHALFDSFYLVVVGPFHSQRFTLIIQVSMLKSLPSFHVVGRGVKHFGRCDVAVNTTLEGFNKLCGAMATFFENLLLGFPAEFGDYGGEVALPLGEAEVEEIPLETALRFHVEVVEEVLVNVFGKDRVKRELLLQSLDEGIVPRICPNIFSIPFPFFVVFFIDSQQLCAVRPLFPLFLLHFQAFCSLPLPLSLLLPTSLGLFLYFFIATHFRTLTPLPRGRHNDHRLDLAGAFVVSPTPKVIAAAS